MLTTLANVRAIPQLRNVVKTPDAWLNLLIGAADAAIKSWCKQNLELQCYIEYYDGNEQPYLPLWQFPVWTGTTQVADASDGLSLPQSTINVASTLNPDGSPAFDPSGRSGLQPSICVQTGITSWSQVQYTGTTATSFTGCTGGTGTLSSTPQRNAVTQPVVWYDPLGYSGQSPQGLSAAGQQNPSGPFGPGTIMAQGAQFMTVVDQQGNKSKRGLLQKIGGYASYGFIGSYPVGGWGGNRDKLASWRLPCWTRGWGNIKVAYSAGYQTVPLDLQYACTTLVARMVREQPLGSEVSNESLGGYSYSILQTSQDPEISGVRRTLSRYAEMSW